MSISPPRYTATSSVRRGRPYRMLTMFWHEFRRRWGIATAFILVLAYLALIITVALPVLLAPPGGASLSDFRGLYGSPIWPFLTLLIAAAAGAGSLADDLGSRAITLYLSRPILLLDYLSAKAASVALWVALVAVGPGLVSVLVIYLLGAVPAATAFAAALAFLAVGLASTIFFTGLSLAFSAATSKSLYAGAGIFGVTLSLTGGVAAVTAVSSNPTVRYLDPLTDIQSVAGAAFRSGGVPATDPALSAILLVAVGLVLGVGAWLRLERVEVVGE